MVRIFFYCERLTSKIYTLSLHDALPISPCPCAAVRCPTRPVPWHRPRRMCGPCPRSEEHTSELQSHSDLVCRLLLEKKKRFRLRTGQSSQPCWRLLHPPF